MNLFLKLSCSLITSLDIRVSYYRYIFLYCMACSGPPSSRANKFSYLIPPGELNNFSYPLPSQNRKFPRKHATQYRKNAALAKNRIFGRYIFLHPSLVSSINFHTPPLVRQHVMQDKKIFLQVKSVLFFLLFKISSNTALIIKLTMLRKNRCDFKGIETYLV